jgi:hypothetical protein
MAQKHYDRDLARAFGTDDREQWTESQRRVVMRIEWLEKVAKEQATRMARLEKAAASAWLSEQEGR